MAVIDKKTSFICLLFSLQQCVYTFKIGYVDIMELLKIGHDVTLDIFETWDLLNSSNPDSRNTFPFVSRVERELKRLAITARKIDTIQEQMEASMDTMVAKLLHDIPLYEKLDQKMRMMDQFIGQINDLYTIFILYSKATNKYERYTLEDFAKTCVSSRPGALPDILKSIHRLFVPSNEDLSRSILILLANEMRVSNRTISSRFSIKKKPRSNEKTLIF